MSCVDENAPLWRERSTVGTGVGGGTMAGTKSSCGQKMAATPHTAGASLSWELGQDDLKAGRQQR